MKKLKQLIKDKKLNYVNENITVENFLDDGRRLKDYKVFHFDRYISSEGAIKEMAKENYVPANIYELLEYDWNGKDWLFALGSSCEVEGRRYVACLYVDGAKRRLLLHWNDDAWDGSYRFLAVKPISNSWKD